MLKYLTIIGIKVSDAFIYIKLIVIKCTSFHVNVVRTIVNIMIRLAGVNA